MKFHQAFILMIVFMPVPVFAGPYSDLNPFGTSLLTLFWYGALILIFVLFLIRALKEIHKNPVRGAAYFILRVSPWAMPFLMLAAPYLLFDSPEPWYFAVGFAFGGFLSFKLIYLNDKYFPFDDKRED